MFPSLDKSSCRYDHASWQVPASLGSMLGQFTGEQTYTARTRTGFLTVLSFIPTLDFAGALQEPQLLLGCSNSSILRQLQLVLVTEAAPRVGRGRM